MFGSANGAFYISLGRNPRIPSQQVGGLKARSIGGYETVSLDGAWDYAGSESRAPSGAYFSARFRASQGAPQAHERLY